MKQYIDHFAIYEELIVALGEKDRDKAMLLMATLPPLMYVLFVHVYNTDGPTKMKVLLEIALIDAKAMIAIDEAWKN